MKRPWFVKTKKEKTISSRYCHRLRTTIFKIYFTEILSIFGSPTNRPEQKFYIFVEKVVKNSHFKVIDEDYGTMNLKRK